MSVQDNSNYNLTDRELLEFIHKLSSELADMAIRRRMRGLVQPLCLSALASKTLLERNDGHIKKPRWQ